MIQLFAIDLIGVIPDLTTFYFSIVHIVHYRNFHQSDGAIPSNFEKSSCGQLGPILHRN